MLNDSVLDLLKENLGFGKNKEAIKKKLRGPKVPAGKQIMSLDKKTHPQPSDDDIATSSKNLRGNIKLPNHQPVSSSADEDEWFCGVCRGRWVADSDVWIQCDMCDLPFHLQCCGLEYSTEDYYELDIEAIHFVCVKCVPVSSDEEY